MDVLTADSYWSVTENHKILWSNYPSIKKLKLKKKILELLPFLSPGDLPDPRIEPSSPISQTDSLPSEGNLYIYIYICMYVYIYTLDLYSIDGYACVFMCA